MTSNPRDGNSVDFVVERQNLRSCKFVRHDLGGKDLGPGQVLLRVSSFAFTANNITYAVAGDMLSYWNFFPAESGWGRIPVWGFADVIRSKHPSVGEGERVFGYLPMSTHLVVEPGGATPTAFVDASPHRRALPVVYNQYTRTATDPAYDAEHEDQQMLFRPLFMTAFLLDDFIADNDLFGARAVVLSSASSKTAFGLGFLLHRNRPEQCEVIGLTSATNTSFVEGLGCYDRVITYDRITSLNADVPTVFVDMAGNGAVASAIHRHLRDNLKHSGIVGATHWDRGERASDLPGPPPVFFFAPTQLEKRMKEWGAGEYQRRYGEAWRDFLGFTESCIRVTHGNGAAAVERVYLETLEGRAKPDTGYVLSLLD
jgi:hypothetical protein